MALFRLTFIDKAFSWHQTSHHTSIYYILSPRMIATKTWQNIFLSSLIKRKQSKQHICVHKTLERNKCAQKLICDIHSFIHSFIDLHIYLIGKRNALHISSHRVCNNVIMNILYLICISECYSLITNQRCKTEEDAFYEKSRKLMT